MPATCARSHNRDVLAYPERIIPDETEPGVVALHVVRYEFALPFCDRKDVLDAACGAGYGSSLLGTRARRVVGVDVSDDAVSYARARYAAENVEFTTADVTALPFADAAFDVVVSFETVEHVRDPKALLREVTRVLRSDGTFVVSTPHVAETNLAPENPFHALELSRADFEALLRERFGDVDLHGQRRLQTARHRLLRRLDVLGLRRRVPALRRAARLTGTPATEELTTADVVISRDSVETATELVAVCRRPRR
jgi:SAM-dependent methyltransferase